MRAWLLLLCLLVPASGEDEVAPEVPNAQMVELGVAVFPGVRMLQDGRYKQALAAFMELHEEHPDNRRLHLLIGQAYFAMNDCAAGEDWVLEHRKRPAFRIRTAALIAACRARQGGYAEAVYWQEEAVLLDADTASTWALLGIYRYRQGDFWGAEEALDEAYALDPTDMRLLYAYATIALSDGNHDNIDQLIQNLRDHPQGALHSYVLEARLELDLGNPVLAADAGHKAVRRDFSGASGLVVKAEALRRQGDWRQAGDLLQRRARGFKQRPAMWAVQARVWIDDGDFGSAHDIIDAAVVANPYDPELVATAWYLARAEGDAEGMASWAELYDVLQPNPYRPLTALVPITEDAE